MKNNTYNTTENDIIIITPIFDLSPTFLLLHLLCTW